MLAVPNGPFQLRITQAGSFDALKFTSVERQSPEAGQVEIEVRATGLNFSDVLKALGLYPGIRDEIVPLGIETSGVVTAVGEGVDGSTWARSVRRRALCLCVAHADGRVRTGAQAGVDRPR